MAGAPSPVRTPADDEPRRPPAALRLVLFRFTDMSAGLVARHHDRPGLGPWDGPSLGVIGVDAHEVVLVTGDPVVWLRPPTLEAAARRLRALEHDLEVANGQPMPFGRLRAGPESGTPRLVVLGVALDADALDRLAGAMKDRAAGLVPRTWPVRFGPTDAPEAASAGHEAIA